MTLALLLISDGREDYLARTLDSIEANLPRPHHFIHIDDSAHTLGFAGAIQKGWEEVITSGARWVWHAEQDFTYHEPVPVAAMIGLLKRQPHLAQVALKRQPVNQQECAAGGIVECNPDDFTEREDVEATWTENKRCFTTNPCVYSADLCRRGWPQVRHSEGIFTHQLVADGYSFAFWGGKYAPPLVEHIGEERRGRGY